MRMTNKQAYGFRGTLCVDIVVIHSSAGGLGKSEYRAFFGSLDQPRT